MKNLFYPLSAFVLISCSSPTIESIDRKQLLNRNNPIVKSIDELSSLSVGNGEFAFTVDATGLQTFPELYSAGVPLGTQSQWGWHSFPNTENYKREEALRNYNFRGWEESYATQYNEPGRQQRAADYYRVNPHRLHLGYVGFDIDMEDGRKFAKEDISNINQHLDLWNGYINSQFKLKDQQVSVRTASHSMNDMIATSIKSDLMKSGDLKVSIRLPYPSGGHCDDATSWEYKDKHQSRIINEHISGAIIEHRLDSTVYYIQLNWEGNASIVEKDIHYFQIIPQDSEFALTCHFVRNIDESPAIPIADVMDNSSIYWQSFWKDGGCVDFSKCTDERAKELERRVVLSQYLMAIQSSGSIPPQETGLTYNSWFGKFHLEMHWWHAAHFALWNRTELLERSMDWYATAYPVAKSIAERQGFKGVRWMKMTDPSGMEAPSKVGSFLIWQQPHFIYMAELIYRNKPTQEVLDKYKGLIEETATFMESFATYDQLEGRYILKGAIPAQETLRASETENPPFELAYWHFAMETAQKWRERDGLKRHPQWDELIDKLSPLAYQEDGLYLAAETALETYKDIRFTSDHMAVLGALGIVPQCKLVREDYMKNTLHWVMKNWNWNKTWGWDYPMTAMCATRLHEPEYAVDALMMDKRTNTYLVNGHNYQDARLRVYLPGNGGLLTAVALMCAGWDGNQVDTPGFPKDGTWDVVWENLIPMP